MSTSRSRPTTSRPTRTSPPSSATLVTDGLFSEKPNDSMVRIDSVVGTGADGEFAKVTDQFLLGETKGVQHSGYFANKDVADKLVSWLQEGLAQPH